MNYKSIYAQHRLYLHYSFRHLKILYVLVAIKKYSYILMLVDSLLPSSTKVT